MELIFNKDGKGSKELKEHLGFLDADFKYKNIKTDIEHATLDLINLIGEETYLEILKIYKKEELTEEEQTLIRYTQLPIAQFAHLAFCANYDLNHSNNGRKIELGADEKIPFAHQIEADNIASRKRGYKALDILLDYLEKIQFNSWINSEIFKEAKNHFISSTKEFKKVFKNFDSRQLFVRLQSAIHDIEMDEIIPVIGHENFNTLLQKKNENDLNTQEKQLVNFIQKAIAFFSLHEAYKTLPVEMFPGTIYNEKGVMSSQARLEVQDYFKLKASSFLEKIMKLNIQKMEEDLLINTEEDIIDPMNMDLMDNGKSINL
ncbi:DUF6712 family protein [Aureivirga marina]|uniref:DUF6712 family protein n=1 Tax=Aureivirga marina TaxID=1182451 RepID=UPI0018CB5787|nr:DUF6712 family protein [Aureivirga marina]